MSEYAFLPGSPFHGDANEVQAELDRIRRTGELTPEAITVVARSKRSILHPLIYDGTTAEEALEKYHLGRARGLLTSIVLVVDNAPSSIRANVRIVSETGRSWESVELPDARATEIARLKREMAGLRARLHDLAIFPSVVQALEEALEEELVAA